MERENVSTFLQDCFVRPGVQPSSLQGFDSCAMPLDSLLGLGNSPFNRREIQ